MHSEMDPVRQNQIQRTVRTAHSFKCAYDSPFTSRQPS